MEIPISDDEDSIIINKTIKPTRFNMVRIEENRNPPPLILRLPFLDEASGLTGFISFFLSSKFSFIVQFCPFILFDRIYNRS